MSNEDPELGLSNEQRHCSWGSHAAAKTGAPTKLTACAYVWQTHESERAAPKRWQEHTLGEIMRPAEHGSPTKGTSAPATAPSPLLHGGAHEVACATMHHEKEARTKKTSPSRPYIH